jgi:hypothetical protein
MIHPQFILPIADEINVDLFAGGGGASTGIEQAIGRHIDIAVNHDPEAISLHEANHPQTRHFVSDVFEVDPLVAAPSAVYGQAQTASISARPRAASLSAKRFAVWQPWWSIGSKPCSLPTRTPV